MKGDLHVLKRGRIRNVEHGVDKTKGQNPYRGGDGSQALLCQGPLRGNDQSQGGEKEDVAVDEKIRRAVLFKARGVGVGNEDEAVEIVGQNQKNQRCGGNPKEIPAPVDGLSLQFAHVEGREKDQMDRGENEKVVYVANPTNGRGRCDEDFVFHRARRQVADEQKGDQLKSPGHVGAEHAIFHIFRPEKKDQGVEKKHQSLSRESQCITGLCQLNGRGRGN